MGVMTCRCNSICSTKPCRLPSIRLESQMQHVYNGKDVFVWLLTDAARLLQHMHEFLLFVSVPRIHFGKSEAAYCHNRHASYGSAWCSCTLQSHILPNISPCYYLQDQLTYLDELYGECNGTACVCTNSGYQALLSNFF